MKRISVVRSAFFFGILLFLAFLTPEPGNHFAGDAAAQSGVNASSFPSDMECTPQPYYRYRADAKPGREMALTLKGGALSGKVAVEITASGKIERTEAVSADGVSFKVLLPPDLAVKNEAVVTLTLRQGDKTLSKTVTVPAMRQWTVYIYPHSHVDIGYTNTQANVELLHITNMMEGIKLAEATTTYPAGAQYKWNPEVTWPVERYWQKSTAAEQTRIINAIKSGQMCLDSSYLNLNTSVCNEEELFQIFRFSREMQQRSGVPIDSFQQMDIPGMSWGLIPVMAQQGVRYIMSWSNGGTRIGNNRLLDEKPFWWIAPDGISKVLFFQPGTYANSGSMTKGGETGRPWFGQRDPDKVPPVIKTGNANVDFTKAILARERPDYPYDFYVVSWSLWDNCPLDADIPDAVKTWNDQYAYPHLEIASGH